jgi:hypothetical protein
MMGHGIRAAALVLRQSNSTGNPVRGVRMLAWLGMIVVGNAFRAFVFA